MSNINDLLGSGAPAFKFENIGDTAKGVITHAERTTVTDFVTGEIQIAANGKEKTQLVLTLRQDDGEEVRVFCKPAAEAAIRQAVSEAKADFEIGGKLALKFSEEKEHEKRGFSPIKQFTAQYQAPVNDVKANDLL